MFSNWRFNRSIADRKGDTLIELLTAIAILAIMAMGTAAGVSRSMSANVVAARHIQAVHLAASLLDQFKAAVCRLQPNAFSSFGQLAPDPTAFLVMSGWRAVNDPPPLGGSGTALFRDSDGEIIPNIGIQGMEGFDPDDTDNDPTLYRIRWQVVDMVDNAVTDRMGKSAVGVALFKSIVVEVGWPIDRTNLAQDPPNTFRLNLLLGDQSC